MCFWDLLKVAVAHSAYFQNVIGRSLSQNNRSDKAPSIRNGCVFRRHLSGHKQEVDGGGRLALSPLVSTPMLNESQQ